MNKILHAIRFATEAHKNQKRKGKETSYIVHPLSVGLLLAKSGAKEDIVIAGILHDTIEDTDVTYGDITEKFSKEIADMVNDVTEQDKSLPWAERKRLALEHVSKMSNDSLLVKTADVLHNMSDQLEDYKTEGDAMFSRFNAGKEAQLERYTKLVSILKEKSKENPLMNDLENIFSELQKLWK